MLRLRRAHWYGQIPTIARDLLREKIMLRLRRRRAQYQYPVSVRRQEEQTTMLRLRRAHWYGQIPTIARDLLREERAWQAGPSFELEAFALYSISRVLQSLSARLSVFPFHHGPFCLRKAPLRWFRMEFEIIKWAHLFHHPNSSSLHSWSGESRMKWTIL